MGIEIIIRNKQSKIWSFTVLALLLLFVTHTNDFVSSVPGNHSQRSEILQWSLDKSERLFKDSELSAHTTSTLSKKAVNYRRKFKHLIEGNDDHSPYVKELTYTRYLRSFVKLNYEPPYFVSEQQSCLYRLSVF
jgi:hypothetical protein